MGSDGKATRAKAVCPSRSTVLLFPSVFKLNPTPGVNFTNILQAAFSYESFLCSFYVLTIWVCNFLAEGFWRKSCS
jgi:hypothetical protein